MNEIARGVWRATRDLSVVVWVRRRVVTRIRRSHIFSRLASVTGTSVASGGVPVPAGAGIPPQIAESYPTVLFVAVDVGPEDLHPILASIQRRQIRDADVKPILLVAGSGLSVVRSFGFAAEAVIPRRLWEHPERSWDNYVEGFVSRMRVFYRPAETVFFGRAASE